MNTPLRSVYAKATTKTKNHSFQHEWDRFVRMPSPKSQRSSLLQQEFFLALQLEFELGSYEFEFEFE